MPPDTLYLPELLLTSNGAQAGAGLLVDAGGLVRDIIHGQAESESAPARMEPAGTEVIRMPGRALLPGLANAHSHTFQRLIRGRTEGRSVGGDTFWTWREPMYRAANFVSPEQLYDVARAAFLEMVCAGITMVGEFHYLHRDRDGKAYDNQNLLGQTVLAAAQSVGLRICLLRSAYFRAGFERDPHPGQKRFYESPDEYLRNLEALAAEFAGNETVSVGAAPHSIRAIPLDDLKRIAAEAHARMPLHMHISEQLGENAACEAEYGMTPVSLISEHGILSSTTTLVHAIHLTEAEFAAVGASGATICSCPTTERNLGDGIFPADIAARLGIPVAFGTDSQAQIDILEDARQLEYHLRLRDQRRGILDIDRAGVGAHLFGSASRNGYRALGIEGGSLKPGEPADFFTVDLNDLSILGLDAASLADQAVFALAKSAVRDVVVQGKLILQNGRHPQAGEIRRRYREIQKEYSAASD